MADLGQDFINRWRTRNHVGQNKPGQFALIRRGHMVRGYGKVYMLDGSELEDIAPGMGGENQPWNAKWVPTSNFSLLPNLTSVEIDKTFEGNGIPTATVQVENVLYQAIAGVLGQYHWASRGYLSPLRGFTDVDRVRQWWNEVNEWTELLSTVAEITIFQGYGWDGAGWAKTFTGLIDKVDMTSAPDHMTIAARSFGGPLLTEQRLFGYNHDPKIKPPITFADRMGSDNLTKVGGSARASSSARGHVPKNVEKPSDKYWMSQLHGAPNVTEWIEVRLPRGRYESFHINPRYPDMEMYLSVYCKNRVQPRAAKGNKKAVPVKKAQIDNVDVEQGWHNPLGLNVPGALGGFPYTKYWPNRPERGSHLKMGYSYEVGDNSILRLSFRNLKHIPSLRGYAAGVKRMCAYQRKQKAEVKKNNWILVDDAADVVKVILMWAGFREWEVESFGARIAKGKPWVFHQSDFLIDIINYVKSQGDYQFFMGDPSSHPESMGVPTFRHSRATAPPPPEMVEVTDADLVSGISVALDHTMKPTIVRVRGKEAAKGVRGSTLGEDTTRRVTGSYRPPWTQHDEIGNVIKHVTHYDNNIGTEIEARLMAILIAYQYALATATGEVQIPGYPGIELDDQISVIDEGTGANTRLWAAHIRSSFTSGDSALWQTTVGGSMLDTKDILGIAIDYILTLVAAQAQRDSPDQQDIGTAATADSGDGG